MMPKMNGLEVLKKLCDQQYQTSNLLLTAKSAVEERIEGLSRGAEDYLRKPFTMEKIVARFRATIR